MKPRLRSVLSLLLVALPVLLGAAPPTAPLPPASTAPEAQRWPGADQHVARLAAAVRAQARRAPAKALVDLYRLHNFSALHAAAEALDGAATALATAPRIPPLVADHARDVRARLSTTDGDGGAPGIATAGWWIGPFDNPAGGGHATAHAPEQPGAARLDWHALTLVPRDGRLSLPAFAGRPGPGTGYLAFVARVPRKTQAALRIGAQGAIKAWVGGALHLEAEGGPFVGLDQHSAPVNLEAGDNLVLVKHSWDEAEARLVVRLTRPEGGSIRNLTFETDRAALESTVAARGRPKARHRIERVQDWLPPSDSADAEALSRAGDLVAVLGLYDAREAPTRPERLLEAAIRKAPDNPRLRFFYAHRVAARAPGLVAPQLRAALTADPGYALAQLEQAQRARAAGRWAAARDTLDRALAQDPTFAALHVARAALGFERLDEEAVALARLLGALDAQPDLRRQPEIWVQIALMRRTLGVHEGARRAAERALGLAPRNPLARSLAGNLALLAGDHDAARAHLDAALTHRPDDIGAHLHRLRVRAAMSGDFEAAAGEARRLAARFPNHAEPHRAGYRFASIAHDEAAQRAALRRAIALDPQDSALRRRLGLLARGEDRLHERYSKDPAELARAPVSELEAAVGAVRLLDQTVIQLHANRQSTRFRQEVLRLHDQGMQDELRQHQIAYAPSRESIRILAADRIRPNGDVIAASQVLDEGPDGKVNGMYIDQRTKRIVFESVEAGDLVHIQYRIDSLGPNIFGGFFGDMAAAQSVLPTRRFEYLATSADHVLHPFGIAMPEPQVRDGGRTVSWALDDIPPLEPEPLGPAYTEIGKVVSVSTYGSWAQLGAWYGRLFSEQMRLDEAARAAGRKATAGATDDADRVRRLYEYVVRRTRYVGIELGIHGWKPYPSALVHQRGYGDCKDKATLLAALLRDQGIEATIALVRTADRGPWPQAQATMWAFNHAVTYVPSLDRFLDPTAEFNGAHELPELDQGATGLIVYPDGRAVPTTLPVAPAADNLNRSDYTASVDRTAELRVEGVERYHGAVAPFTRAELQTPKTRRQTLEMSLAESFPGLSVSELEVEDLRDLSRPAGYRLAFEVPGYGRAFEGGLELPVALFRHQLSASYAALPRRKHDIVLSHPWTTRNVVRYRLPAGARVEQLPEPVTIETPHVRLVQVIRRTEDGFEVDDTVIVRQRVVPARDYPTFRDACARIDEAQRRPVVIRW